MRARLTLWEWVAAAAVVAGVCAAYLSLAWYGFDLLDEGYFLTHARRVQLGGLPYRDFDAPYTPGVFYLYAWMLDWAGSSMVALRAPAVIGRGITFLLLYVLGRRLMPPFFAALAPLVILCVDRAPPYWSIHPGWIATPSTLLSVLAVTRYLDGAGTRWLFVAGLGLAGGFAFKQNLAVFVLMAALWLLVVLEPRLGASEGQGSRSKGQGGGPAARALALLRGVVRAAALLALPLSALYLVRPYLSPLVAALFVVPLAALSVAGAWWARGRGGVTTMERELRFYGRPLLVVAGLAVATAPWVGVLVWALEGRVELLRGFVGQVDPSGYFYGMAPPDREDWRLLAITLMPPIVLAGVWMGVTCLLAGPRWVKGAAVVALLLASGAAAARREELARAVTEGGASLMAEASAAWGAYLGTAVPDHPTDDVVLYLPSLAFWAGLLMVLRPGWPDLVRVWYLAAGACLLLGQYPRMGYGHIVWSGGVLYVVGADCLYALYRRLVPTVRRAGTSLPSMGLDAVRRATVGLGFALLPAAAVLPYVVQRVDGIAAAMRAPREESAARPGDHLVPLRLPEVGRPQRLATAATAHAAASAAPFTLEAPPHRPRVWASADQVRPILGVVELLTLHSEPGEPIFVYPAIPGIYYLADRPNATRFNHLFAGMASPEDQLEMVRQLETVRWVVWDDEEAYAWVTPQDNAPVMLYLREHFRIARKIGPYAVLSREGDGPVRPVVAPTAS